MSDGYADGRTTRSVEVASCPTKAERHVRERDKCLAKYISKKARDPFRTAGSVSFYS